MSETHPELFRILKEIGDLYKENGADCGVADGILLDVSRTVDWGAEPWIGTMVRTGDKVIGLKAAVGGELENEGVEYSLMDLPSYAMIALALFREGKSNE